LYDEKENDLPIRITLTGKRKR